MSIDYSSFTGSITVVETGKIAEIKKERKSLPPGALRQKEIIKKYGCTQNLISYYSRKGTFPKPVSYVYRVSKIHNNTIPLYCPKEVKAFFSKLRGENEHNAEV